MDTSMSFSGIDSGTIYPCTNRLDSVWCGLVTERARLGSTLARDSFSDTYYCIIQ
jgi:hypothetical protein